MITPALTVISYSSSLCVVDAVVIVVVAPSSHLRVEVACEYERSLHLRGIGVDCGNHVVHALDVLVSISTAWKISRGDPELVLR